MHPIVAHDVARLRGEELRREAEEARRAMTGPGRGVLERRPWLDRMWRAVAVRIVESRVFRARVARS